MPENKELTNLTLVRLRSLAKGNGLDPEKIELIESVEKTYSLTAQLRLEPDVNVKTRRSFGRVKARGGAAPLPSMAALAEAIENERKSVKEKTDWLDAAVKELETEPGYGWGHDGATVFWDKTAQILCANEACATCRGTGHSTCPECKGIGTVHCTYCDGRGQEYCILCQGTGEDPQHAGQPCPHCHGTKFSPCRWCQPLSGLPGRMPCPRCQMKGSTPCADCQGTGFITQETEIKKCAVLSFSLGPTTDLPSGLLRIVQRIGDDNLHKHVKISMMRANVNAGENPLVIRLTASVPYADVKLRIGKKSGVINVLGEKGRTAGVPPFLDGALKGARELLAQAAKGAQPIEKALKARALGDALGLVLSGKTNPNEFRRLYPIGLSEGTAKEIMGNMTLAVRGQTRKIRAIVGSGFFVLGTIIFAGLFLTPLFGKLTATFPPLLIQALLIAIPVITLLKGWFILSRVGRWSLKKQFGKDTVGAAQPIGHVGHGILVALLIVYAAILHFAGYLL